MGEGEDKIDKVVISIVALIVGVVMLCSAAIPIISSQVTGLNDLISGSVMNIPMLQSLLGVAVVFTILGLIIVIVRGYTKSDR